MFRPASLTAIRAASQGPTPRVSAAEEQDLRVGPGADALAEAHAARVRRYGAAVSEPDPEPAEAPAPVFGIVETVNGRWVVTGPLDHHNDPRWCETRSRPKAEEIRNALAEYYAAVGGA